MTTPIVLQSVLIGATVAWAALSALRRFLPATSRRAQATVLGVLDRTSAPAWLRELARRLQPHATTGASCGDGCSSCGGCAAAAATPAVEAQPLVFKPRTKA